MKPVSAHLAQLDASASQQGVLQVKLRRLPSRMEQLVRFMHLYHRERGHWPAFREMLVPLGIKSLHGIHYWTQEAIRLGFVGKRTGTRSLRQTRFVSSGGTRDKEYRNGKLPVHWLSRVAASGAYWRGAPGRTYRTLPTSTKCRCRAILAKRSGRRDLD